MAQINKHIQLLLSIFLLTGCATSSNINKFKAFSIAGAEYQKAISDVTDAAILSNIDSTSYEQINLRDTLLANHNTKSPLPADDINRLTEAINNSNQGVLNSTEAFLALKKQTALLTDYFSALGALANYDGASGLTDATNETVVTLEGFIPSLKQATIGDASVNGFVTQAVPIAVANFQSSALEKELKAHATTIDNQLRLQSLLLEDIAKQLKSDKRLISNINLDQKIVLPFTSTKDLPKNWVKDRREILLSTVDTATAADQAVTLSKKMRTSFISLVEGRLEVSDLNLVADDLSTLAELIETVRGSKT